MPMPSDPTARKYYRAAGQRWIEAVYLFDGEMPVGAVYLAGYCVECMLKALIISNAPPGKRETLVGSFRGGKAHNFGWLKDLYRAGKGANFPAKVIEAFNDVVVWDTDLRYEPGTIGDDDAEPFLRAADVIRAWADSRLN